MNILLISECNKIALTETRKIIDQFAERKGQRTWQTPITFEGLKTLRILLKKTARRNTAVACYRIYGKNQTELLWIVGNRKRFNLQGTVPTNRTSRNILKTEDESFINSSYVSALMAGIAGLFHDFGKANPLFQKKLTGKGKNFEPYRHEWVSAHLFLAFVNNRSDKDWLTHLANLTNDEEKYLLNNLPNDPLTPISFDLDSSFAGCILWLILSHHRLPKKLNDNMLLDDVETWFKTGVSPEWNALNHTFDGFNDKDKLKVFNFKSSALPIASKTWRQKAKEFASRALKINNLSEYAKPEMAYPLHIARLSLMLGDHVYSSDNVHVRWQDPTYKTFANTDRKTKELKQKLDEHCIGVANNAYMIAKVLPQLGNQLPVIAQHPELKKRTKLKNFRWQNTAFDLACGIRESSYKGGFFGVNMASTGKGKTFANARIMYGLSAPQIGCRFSVALGLRTLSLQTGDALQERLKLDEDDLAVVIGSKAVQELYEKDKNNQKSKEFEEKIASSGSESEDIFAEHLYVKYDGEISSSALSRWLGSERNTKRFINKLINAPISVSTIDYLIGASEGTSGGQQIAPLLRLMTSDLVLDEPDDFGNDDLPALSRLVYFAGLMGSRVLLSSATLPPSLVSSLFDAYLHGRRQFNLIHNEQKQHPVMTAWFDEYKTEFGEFTEKRSFLNSHKVFVSQRLQKLIKESIKLRIAEFLPIQKYSDKPIENLAETILKGAQQLANWHHTATDDKTFSVGIVRMANIEPLIAVTNSLLTKTPSADARIHYCVYHSQHPLAARSAIESNLDLLLKRNPKVPITELPIVKDVLKKYPEKHHILIVLATPVAEVGRDHDYDWAIVEPSSMRSIVQLAGRVQRHRQIAVTHPNIFILTQNYRGLRKEDVVFCKPGFEKKEKEEEQYEIKLNKIYKKQWLKLANHNLENILDKQFLNPITAESRIIEPELKELIDLNTFCAKDFIALEHLALKLILRDKANVWWNQPHAHLYAEIQKQTPFRQSYPTQQYTFFVDQDTEAVTMEKWDDLGKEYLNSDKLKYFDLPDLSPQVSIWNEANLLNEITQLAEDFDLSINEACQKFATIDLRCLDDGLQWQYHPLLGVFRGKEMN